MDNGTKKTQAISELPADELVRYGSELGLELNPEMGRGELLRLVRERQELLLELDREAMLDIAVWARHPVRKSAGKEELARHIATIKKMEVQTLGDRGLVALARLRGLVARDGEPRNVIEARLRDAECFWDRVRRQRRKLVGSLITKAITGSTGEESEAYRFLPEEAAGVPSLKEHIAEEGVVGGIARKLRGVADDYVREKLDEIEARIDRKLDEIDQRLAEWRDREMANRLKIIKITLVASVIVALLSLIYTYLRPGPSRPDPASQPAAEAEWSSPPRACEAPPLWV
ncbi:MAG TPA: hypothetical protein PKY77_14155 [Phycisphaerae bacterium]|nr:hypothetical protein [Phycisphaerae bacterium]HRY67715.1 hypothetical protein [Phycisphaerae bacterium]HSA25167.1 hypothetical protein [Phycisphaerae bacterium]